MLTPEFPLVKSRPLDPGGVGSALIPLPSGGDENSTGDIFPRTVVSSPDSLEFIIMGQELLPAAGLSDVSLGVEVNKDIFI